MVDEKVKPETKEQIELEVSKPVVEKSPLSEVLATENGMRATIEWLVKKIEELESRIIVLEKK